MADNKKPVAARAKTSQAEITRAIAAVMNKYIECGYVAFRPPGNTINDIVAYNAIGSKYHFVQVIIPAIAENKRYQGLPRNTFIQNAFSNGAVPVYARMESTGNDAAISFEDINLLKNIEVKLLQKRKKANTGATGAQL